MRYAQTNLQLYAQARAEGYDEVAQEALVDAYTLAVRLFAGLHRASGKNFLAHLVGTASALVEARSRISVVAAGLLHAAYTHGEFGDGWRGMTVDKRARVAAVVGEECEGLIARYTDFRWRSEALSQLRETLAGFAGADRDVLLMRLANELDDHLDLGVLFYADAERRLRLLEPLAVCVDLARDLGHHRLAGSLAEAFAACRAGTIPGGTNRPGWRGSFLVAPASHRPSLRIRLRQWRAGMVRLFSGADERRGAAD
jgi:(p)ppGpp synthase/HD superfamily hydrolase